ncbi:hypothetical protein AKJ16_DCAP04675 [Drosera capensis]
MASTADDESSPPPSSSSPPRTTTESSQSALPSPSAAVYTLCTEQPLDGPNPESHHLRILSSVLGRVSIRVWNALLWCLCCDMRDVRVLYRMYFILFAVDLKREERNELWRKMVIRWLSRMMTRVFIFEVFCDSRLFDRMSNLGFFMLQMAKNLLYVDQRREATKTPVALDSKAKCSAFFTECYGLSEVPDYKDVQNLAREQLARLVLDSDNELDQPVESSSLMSKAAVTNVEMKSQDMPSSASNSNVLQLPSLENTKQEEDLKKKHDLVDEARSDRDLTVGDSKLRTQMPSCVRTAFFSRIAPLFQDDGTWAVCRVAPASAPEFDISNYVWSKFSAVSEAIRSLRFHLRRTEPKIIGKEGKLRNKDSSVCKCRNTECIEACDIKEWIQKVKLNQELWKLTLLLVESYMALEEAYKEGGMMDQSWRAVNWASSLCKCMAIPLELDSRDEPTPTSFKSWTLFGDVYAKDYSMRQDWEISDYESKRISNTFGTSSSTSSSSNKGGSSVTDDCVSLSLLCYEKASRDFYRNNVEFKDRQEVKMKLGWVWNELGRRELKNKNFPEAVAAFLGALSVFEEVSDCTNVVIINCNLGYARRVSAEEMVSNIKQPKKDARLLVLERVMEYVESLRYYHAAKSALPVVEDGGDVPDDVRKGACTQLAQTYLKLGMFLSREGIVAFIDDFGGSKQRKLTEEQKYNLRQHEISAEDAVSEALSLYDSLGELGKQDAADAYFQLGCHQNGCYWNIIDPKGRSSEDPKMETGSSQVKANEAKQLAEEYWQKTIEFYSADAYPDKYLEILVAWSTLSFNPSSSFHSDNKMLESALDRLLDGLAVSSCSKDIESRSPKLFADFRKQLQGVLHKLCQLSTKSSSASQANLLLKRSADEGKLRKLYLKSLYFTDLNQLQEMHQLWNSE